MSDTPRTGTLIAVVGRAAAPVEVLRVSGSGPRRPLRGLSGKPMAVPEGTYWVQAVLPVGGGRNEATNAAEVVVSAGAESRVVLDDIVKHVPSPPIPLPHAAPSPKTKEAVSNLAPLSAATALGLLLGLSHFAPLNAVMALGSLIGFRYFAPLSAVAALGSLLRFTHRHPSSAPPSLLRRWSDDAAGPLSFGRSGVLRIGKGVGGFIAVVPVAAGGSTEARVIFPQAGQPGPLVRLRFDDPALNRLWEFTIAGSMELARVMAEAVVDAPVPPQGFHAALACYVLMRIGWDGDLLGFAETALAVSPLHPDLLSAKAELLGRQGRHDEAALALATMGTGQEPWPLLRPGIDYARKRLSQALLWKLGGSDTPLQPIADKIMAISTMMDPNAYYLLLRTADVESTAALLSASIMPLTPELLRPDRAADQSPG